MKPIIYDMLRQGIAFSSVSLLAFLAALGIARTISSPVKRLRSHARVLRDRDLAQGLSKMVHQNLRNSRRRSTIWLGGCRRTSPSANGCSGGAQKGHDELELRLQERTEELQQHNQADERNQGAGTARGAIPPVTEDGGHRHLAGGIAHDFNNILFAIIGFTELAIDDVSDNAPAQRNMGEVLKAGLGGGTSSGRSLPSAGEGTRRSMRCTFPRSGRRSSCCVLRPTTIEMKLDLDAHRDLAYADPSQIQQIIMNPFNQRIPCHAGEGRHPGGIVTRNHRQHQELLPEPDMAPGEYLVLSVRDTGHGMDDRVMKRIFEPFFTTKEKGQGTGLGLSVVYGIVKSHHGGIRVSTRPGQGSVITVYLPAAPTVAEVESEAVSWDTLPTGTERILFVDDEEPIVELGQGVLRRLGFHSRYEEIGQGGTGGL